MFRFLVIIRILFKGYKNLSQNVHQVLSWIWLPLTSTAHHPWTTSPIMHCTHTFPSTITPITQLSPFTHQPWLPHHTCTSFTHSHKRSTQTLTQCEVLFFLCNNWQVRGESRSTNSFISTRSNRQISSRGIESNVDKAESKSETEQWVRAGGRQRGLPEGRQGQRGRQQTIRRGSQQSR